MRGPGRVDGEAEFKGVLERAGQRRRDQALAGKAGKSELDAWGDRIDGELDGVAGDLAELDDDIGEIDDELDGKASMSALAAKADKNELPPIVQSKQISVSGTAGLATWVFDVAFDIVPIVGCSALSPASASYVSIATVVDGTVTKTQCQILVVRLNKSVTLGSALGALLGATLTLFGFAPAVTTVNCFARRPTS